jgi:hypothetical protein
VPPTRAAATPGMATTPQAQLILPGASRATHLFLAGDRLPHNSSERLAILTVRLM